MDDDLHRLEATLREKAAEIPYLQTAPRSVLSRARRRIARNAAVSAAAAMLVIWGASAVLATSKPDARIPGSNPSTPAVSACAAADLGATAVLDGAAGSVEGSIDLRNTGADGCTLRGRPSVTLVSSEKGTLSIGVTDVPPQWQVDGTPTPTGWPVVTLRPGDSASIRVRWSNACPQLGGSVIWRIDLGPGGAVDPPGSDRIPPCLGSGQPQVLEVGPFEPAHAG